MHRYILTAVALCALALGGCGSVAPTPEELNDPSIALHVTVMSTPSGATVYGVDGDELGDSLGTTPFTAKYIQRRVADRPKISGTVVDQTIGSNMNFRDLDIDMYDPYFFQCWLVKSGYKTQRVVKGLSQSKNFNPRDFSTTDTFKPGAITVMVDLAPSGSDQSDE